MASSDADWWWSLVTALVRTTAFAWAAAESLGHWRLADKRAALGLTSTGTARRFLLWGVAMLGVAAMSAVPIVYRLLPVHGSDDAWTLGQSAIGLVAAIAMARAFAPPRRASEGVSAAG